MKCFYCQKPTSKKQTSSVMENGKAIKVNVQFCSEKCIKQFLDDSLLMPTEDEIKKGFARLDKHIAEHKKMMGEA